MPEGFFAGFASRMGQNLMGEMQRRNQEEQQAKKVQLEMLMDMASRPDLRDEFKQPLLTQLISLAGAKPGKGSKGKPGFEDGVKTILELFDKPSQPQAEQPAMMGESEELAQLMGVGQGTNTRPRRVADFVTPPTFGGEIPGLPQRGAFYTQDEMFDRQGRQLERQLQLKQKYDRRNLEDANWKDTGQVIVGPDGRRKITQVNMVTGEVREGDLPIGETLDEKLTRDKELLRAQRNPSADKAIAKIDAEAAKLASIQLGPDATKDPKVREQFFAAAAQNLVNKDELSAEAVRAGIEYRRAGAAATRVNTPQPGQPTAAAQRSFTQITKQVSEIEDRIKQLTGPRGVTASVGQKLRDGTVITAPGDAPGDVDRFLKQREQLLKELNEDVERLKKQRQSAATSGGVPQRASDILGVGGTSVYSNNYGESKQVGEEFDVGPNRYKVIRVLPDGRYEVKRLK